MRWLKRQPEPRVRPYLPQTVVAYAAPYLHRAAQSYQPFVKRYDNLGQELSDRRRLKMCGWVVVYRVTGKAK